MESKADKQTETEKPCILASDVCEELDFKGSIQSPVNWSLSGDVVGLLDDKTGRVISDRGLITSSTCPFPASDAHLLVELELETTLAR